MEDARRTRWRKRLSAAAASLRETLPAATRKTKPLPEPQDEPLAATLRRLTFGPSVGDQELAASLGIDGFVAYQLDEAPAAAAGFEQQLAELFPALDYDYEQLVTVAEDRDQEVEPAFELLAASVLRALLSPAQLYERLVDFWSNHFHSFLLDGPVQYFKIADDRELVRPFVLTSFEELLKASARSPSMLYYLDNYLNTRFGPNENYARELMELHTLGVNGGYSERDVTEVARAFTGWTISREEYGLFRFEPAAHDFDGKSILGTDFAAGQGIEDGEQVLELLAGHPSTAAFLSTKLVTRFASAEASSELQRNVEETFSATHGDLHATITALATDPLLARAPARYRLPQEHFYAAGRAFDLTFDEEFFDQLLGSLQQSGQLPFFATPPTGYEDDEGEWLNTNALLVRWNFASRVAFPSGRTVPGYLSDAQLQQRFPNGANVIEILENTRTSLALRRLTSTEEHAILKYAAAGDSPFVRYEGSLLRRAQSRVVAALLSSPAFSYR